jgi:hypothetical protein
LKKLHALAATETRLKPSKSGLAEELFPSESEGEILPVFELPK